MYVTPPGVEGVGERSFSSNVHTLTVVAPYDSTNGTSWDIVRPVSIMSSIIRIDLRLREEGVIPVKVHVPVEDVPVYDCVCVCVFV